MHVRMRVLATGLLTLTLGTVAQGRTVTPALGISRELPTERQRWESKRCTSLTGRMGIVRTPETISPEALRRCELYVVRVSEVRDEGATFTRPPRVALTVEQVLLGKPPSQPLPAVFSDPADGHLCGNGVLEEEKRRKDEPLKGPPLGARLIVAGGWNTARDWFEVTSSNQWPFSEKRLAQLQQALSDARGDDPSFDKRIAKERREDLAGQSDEALVAAVEAGDLPRVQELLAGGARASASDFRNRSALFVAVQREDLAMVRLLLRHLPRGTQDEVALTEAVTKKDAVLVQLLMKGGLSWKGPPQLNGPLHDAASMGACDVLTVLLKAGANPNAPGQDLKSPLHHATSSREGLRCVPLLLKFGARADGARSMGWTPLMYVASEPHSPEAEAAVRALVAGGARVNRKTPDGIPLRLLASDEKMAELLRRLGAR